MDPSVTGNAGNTQGKPVTPTAVAAGAPLPALGE
eukprot:gene33836-63095_t